MLPRPAWLALGVVAAAVAGVAAGSGPAAGVARVAPAAAGVVCVLALAAAGAVRGVRRSSHRRLAPGFAAAALGAGLVAARLAAGIALAPGAAGAVPVAASGTSTWHATVEAAHLTKGHQLATIDVAGTNGATQLTCSATMPADPRLVAGDRIAWTGRVEPLGDTDYDRYLAAQDIAAKCEADAFTVTAHDRSPAGWLEQFRQASGDAIQRVVPEPAGGLAAAILIGLRDRVDRDVAASFTTAGVSHIVAISGWNIAVVSATLAALLRRRTRRRPRAVLTAAAVVGYTLFAGASASVVRAAVMSLVALATLESGRGARVSVGLSWAAALMIVAEPSAITDIGFLLSAAATAGLIAWATPLTHWLDDRAPRLPQSIRESLGVSMAAQLATLPLVLAAFGRLALIAPAANLAAVPLVPPAMGLGLVALVAGWFSMLGGHATVCGLVALPATLLLTVLIDLVGFFAALPGANETLAPPWSLVLAALAAAGLVPIDRSIAAGAKARAARPKPALGSSRTPPGRPVGRAVGAVCLTAVVAVTVFANRPNGEFHVVVLDVGQGDAILLEGNRGGRILVDGGPDGVLLLHDLDAQIPSWDRRLDAIVLTHPHDDHVTGLVSVLDRYRVGTAYESGWPSDTPEYRAWRASLASRQIRLDRLSTGSIMRLDDATLRVLWPDDGRIRSPGLDADATDNRKTNDASVVLLGQYEDRRFLLTGDAEDDVDPLLLARGLPRVDLLKVAHHGSATATSAALLDALRPAVAVISVGADNKYGHPNAGTLARLSSVSARIWRTDQSGTVDVALDRASVRVTSSRRAVAAVGPQNPTPCPLLYDSSDGRSEPGREHGAAPLARSTVLAFAPLARRRGDRGVARVARGTRRHADRSPPRRGRGPAP